MTDQLGVRGPQVAAVLVEEPTKPAKSFGRITWERFRSHRLAFVAAIVLVLLAVAFWVGPILSPYEFDEITPDIRQGPSWDHPFGTDDIGRDLMVRTFMGGRFSLWIAFLVAGLTTVLGTAVGALAGYAGGWIDALANQIVNLFLIVPVFVVLLVVAIRWGGEPVTISILLAILLWPTIARVVRGLVLSVKEQEFVLAAIAAGAKSRRVVFRHVLPNVVGPIVVNATLLIGIAIVFESTLSFLGLGVRPPTPTLGNLIQEAKGAIDSAPSRILIPGGFVVAITLSVNYLGDGLRDALDPGSR